MTNDRLEQSRFDRLVDGELSANEYKSLLVSLDDEPGGWRQCAIAFLESQALANELGTVRRSMNVREDSADKVAAAPMPARLWGDAATLLAIAASFLLAFGLGILAPRFFSSGRQEADPAGNLNLAGIESGGENDLSEGGSRHQTMRPIGNVKLIMDGPSGESSEAEFVPVYEVGPDVEKYLAQDAPVLRPELLELLRQQGYDVQHQQQFFPAPLDDGRQIIVPLDGYRITPVSRRY